MDDRSAAGYSRIIVGNLARRIPKTVDARSCSFSQHNLLNYREKQGTNH